MLGSILGYLNLGKLPYLCDDEEEEIHKMRPNQDLEYPASPTVARFNPANRSQSSTRLEPTRDALDYLQQGPPKLKATHCDVVSLGAFMKTRRAMTSRAGD